MVQLQCKNIRIGIRLHKTRAGKGYSKLRDKERERERQKKKKNQRGSI